MAYNVKYRGLSLSCDSPEEVDRLADRLEANHTERHHSIKDVVAAMGEGPQKLLGILLDEKDSSPMASAILCKRMNLDANKLAGKITGVTLPIKKAGFDPILLSAANGNGKRQYWLDLAAVDEVREGLGMK